jgi:hypothetical protein
MDSYSDSVNSHGVYFKSLARKTPVENCVPHQSIRSAICGQYSLYFIKNRLCGMTFYEIMNMFKWNPNNINRMVARWYYAMFQSKIGWMNCDVINQHCKSKLCYLANKIYSK